MKRFRLLVISAFVLSTVCAATAQKKSEKGKAPAAASKRHHKKGKPPTAASLVADMNAAVAFISREAKKDMNPKSKQERPFWSGLKQMSDSLDIIEKGVKAGDASILKGLQNFGTGLAKINTAWGMLRGSEKTSKIGRGIVALHNSYVMFMDHFGPSVARYKKGGKVSAAELTQVTKCNGELKKFKDKFLSLKSKAEANSISARMVDDLIMAIDILLAEKVENVQQYCGYLHVWDLFGCNCAAYDDCIEVWSPEFYTSWTTVCNETSVSFSVFWESSVTYYAGWSYSTESIKSYADYYESTVEVASAEVTSEETSIESYTETAATVESEAEEKLVEADVPQADKEDPEPFCEEVGDSDDDADGDGIEDDEDKDDDNDGSPDSADKDDDGDGVTDAEDTDSADDDDGDGIDDETDTDDDNDGTADAEDTDDDGDGIADDDEPEDDEAEDDDDMDSDDDGIADDVDSDDDNDGTDDAQDEDDDGDGISDEDDSGGDDDGGGDE